MTGIGGSACHSDLSDQRNVVQLIETVPVVWRPLEKAVDAVRLSAANVTVPVAQPDALARSVTCATPGVAVHAAAYTAPPQFTQERYPGITASHGAPSAVAARRPDAARKRRADARGILPTARFNDDVCVAGLSSIVTAGYATHYPR
jgi:hypothetical protein